MSIVWGAEICLEKKSVDNHDALMEFYKAHPDQYSSGSGK